MPCRGEDGPRSVRRAAPWRAMVPRTPLAAGIFRKRRGIYYQFFRLALIYPRTEKGYQLAREEALPREHGNVACCFMFCSAT